MRTLRPPQLKAVDIAGKACFTGQMQSEFWEGVEYRPIASHPLLFISDTGKILSFRTRGPGGQNRRTTKPPVFVRGSLDKDGYYFITWPKKLVHQLVLLAWVGERPSGHVARHINSVRTDNRLANLAWGTERENHNDRIELGSSKGARNGAARMTEADVLRIRAEYIHKPLAAIERANPQWSSFAIWAAASGYTWAHLPGAIPGRRRCSKEGWKSGIRVSQQKGAPDA